MTSKDNINFQASSGFFGFGPEESELNYRLSQIMREKRREEDRRMREHPETAVPHAELHNKGNNKPIPFKQSVISQAEQEEIDAILAELDDIPAVSPYVDTAPEPKKSVSATVPAMPEPVVEPEPNGVRRYAESSDLVLNPELVKLTERERARKAAVNAEINAFVAQVNLLSLPIDVVLKLHRSHFSGDFVYDDTKRALNRNIALALTYQDVSPIERHFPKFDGTVCKRKSDYSAYMRDLQIFDLLWIWHTHKGHQTDSEAHKGLFADIFTGDQFDLDRALAIAIGQFERKSGKIGNLTAPKKIKFLRLPECWQEELAVLRFDAIRQRQHEAKKKARQAKEERDGLMVRAIDIRHKLDEYAKINPVDTRDIDMDECVNIWIALQYSGGKINNLAGIMAAYEKLTGSSIDKSKFKSKLRRRIALFKRALIL
jgi:hypothetical protein